MSEQTEQQAPTVETTPVEQKEIRINVDDMSQQDRLVVLQHLYGFFSSFDRVPGALAKQWGSSLDALAAVANSINSEIAASAKSKASKKKLADKKKK